jgi:hypothetical protein
LPLTSVESRYKKHSAVDAISGGIANDPEIVRHAVWPTHAPRLFDEIVEPVHLAGTP